MLVVFVRQKERDAEAILAKDLVGQGDAEVGASASGPFMALTEAIDADAVLRDRFARSLLVPSVQRWRMVRPWFLLGLVPVAVLVDLERQLVSVGTAGVAGRLFTDIVLGIFCLAELARPLPAHPRTWAVAMASMSARYAFMIAANCGSAFPAFWFGAVACAVACVAALMMMPSRTKLAAEVRDALHVAPSATKRETAPLPISLALAAAVALPLILAVSRAIRVPTWGVAIVFVVVGGGLPFLLRTKPSVTAAARPLAIVDAAVAGLAGALGLSRSLHYAVIATMEALRCSAPGLHATLARWTEDDPQVARAPQSHLVFVVMVVLVVPIIEERLYRHVLQRALRARVGRTRGIGITGAVFGLAHMGVYRTAIAQTALLGVAFGAAYEEAGLLAAVGAHALYNATQLF